MAMSKANRGQRRSRQNRKETQHEQPAPVQRGGLHRQRPREPLRQRPKRQPLRLRPQQRRNRANLIKRPELDSGRNSGNCFQSRRQHQNPKPNPNFVRAPQSSELHSFVVGPAPTFRYDPIDNLVGIGNIASFAVYAVRSVYFQSELLALGNHFIHGGWAKILAGIAILSNAAVNADTRLEDVEVARLVFVVAGSGVIHIGQPVKCQLAIALKARGLIDQFLFAIQLVIFLVASRGAPLLEKATAAGDELQRRMKQPGPEAFLISLVKIAYSK